MTNEDKIIGWEITTNEYGVEMATLPAERLRKLVAMDAAREDEAIRVLEWVRENALYGNPGYWEVHPIDGIVLSLNSKKLYQYHKKQNP